MYKSGVVNADSGGSSLSNIRTSTGSFLPLGEQNDHDRRELCLPLLPPSFHFPPVPCVTMYEYCTVNHKP